MEPELETLFAFYSDLDRSIVQRVWEESDHDYQTAMGALAEIAKNPASATSLGTARVHTEDEPHRPPLSSSVPEAGTSSSHSTSDHHPAWKSEAPPPHAAVDESQYAYGWDLSSFATALADLGNTVSDGITGIADNISDLVSDLASAFDSGWDDGQDHGVGPHTQASDRGRAVVAAGGMDSQRVSNRRQPGTLAASVPATRVEWEDGEDDKKDA